MSESPIFWMLSHVIISQKVFGNHDARQAVRLGIKKKKRSQTYSGQGTVEKKNYG